MLHFQPARSQDGDWQSCVISPQATGLVPAMSVTDNESMLIVRKELRAHGSQRNQLLTKIRQEYTPLLRRRSFGCQGFWMIKFGGFSPLVPDLVS